MRIKRGLLLIPIIFLLVILSVNAQNFGYYPIHLQIDAFWIWPAPCVIYHSATFNRWQSWHEAQIGDSTSDPFQPLTNWVLSGDPHLEIRYPRVLSFVQTTEAFLNVGNTYSYQGIPITLENVGPNGAIVVNVNGAQETIPSGITETVSGISITNTESYYDHSIIGRGATLVLKETFDYGYLATYLCCNSQTEQCPNNAREIITYLTYEQSPWLCGWQMRRITPL